ncbi:SdpI family protein [Flavobacterium dankookense]|uniref:SdpI/YhfL family protein n=1 Tax=Flavobacterium dankookense TaxID=706186 RepID=A0A4R6QCP4_9FLAO|nr:SdpI family protein [Flavobacterium dankookense]TDP60040.1 SdpI/YhfL family protein [Flavobacterium dankookense]
MEAILTYIIENLFFMPFLIGIVFFITAFITLRFPPKKINDFYGYRTGNSMRNQQVWNFSQKYSSIKMLQSALFLVAISFLGMVFHPDEKVQLIVGIGLSILVCVYIFYTTEKAIKKNFPNL